LQLTKKVDTNGEFAGGDTANADVYDTLLRWFLTIDTGTTRSSIAPQQVAMTVTSVILGASIQPIR